MALREPSIGRIGHQEAMSPGSSEGDSVCIVDENLETLDFEKPIASSPIVFEVGQVIEYQFPSFPESEPEGRTPEPIWVQRQGVVLSTDDVGVTVVDSKAGESWRWINRAFIYEPID